MTKTLTEQWREETLQEGLYYIEGNGSHDIALIRNRFCPVLTSPFCEDDVFESEFVPVDHVPSYDEYKELRKLPLKCFQLEEDNSALMVINKDMCKEIERLQEQLKEANEVIKWYAQPDTGSAKDYLEKWGVK